MSLGYRSRYLLSSLCLRSLQIPLKNNVYPSEVPFYEQVHGKRPFPPQSLPAKLEQTAQFIKSGRIEFYKDEDAFLEAGEQLPVHKPPFEESEYAQNPAAREKYTFNFVTRNAIYRVHSTHSNNLWMNELQELYGIESNDLNAIKKEIIHKEKSIEDILKPIKERSAKLSLLYELITLCYVDESYDLLERQGMKRISAILDIEESKLHEIENVILESIELQKKINV